MFQTLILDYSFINMMKSLNFNIDRYWIHLTPTKAPPKLGLVQFSKHGMSILFSHYYSLNTYSGTDFLMKPVLLRGFSGSLHLILLFVLFIKLVCNKFKVGHSEGPKERFKNIRCLYHKQAQICLGVSVFSLVLCLLNYLFFFWATNWAQSLNGARLERVRLWEKKLA